MWILTDLIWLLGWVLGILAFVRVGKLRREVRALQRALAALAPSAQTALQDPLAGSAGFGSTAEFVPPMGAPADQFSHEAGHEAGSPQGAGPVTPPTAPSPASGPTAAPATDLEAQLTMRWGVWLGAVALVLAGVFLVRYAADQGLIGPATRCGSAALLGIALLAAAELLRRQDTPLLIRQVSADQAPAGLAAGGAAILFGACYGAGPFYDLVPPLIAFALMAAASLVALLAALRFGPLTAAVGIAGAFITPALVVTEAPSLPGLFVYLFAVSAAALLVVRQTAWTWLGWATTIAGAVWVCLAAVQEAPDRWAAAAFVPAAAWLHLLLLPADALNQPVGRRLSWVPFLALGVAALFLEAVVPGLAPKAALFLLSPIAVWKGMREPRLDRLPWLAVGLGLLTLLFWALPEWQPTGTPISSEGVVFAVLPGAWAPEVIRPLLFAAMLFAAFHALVGLWQEHRAPHPLRWAGLASATPVLTLIVAYAQVARFQTDLAWALVALALAAGLTAAAARASVETALQRAGVHAAGAVAALALGCAMLLRDEWLTLAVALFLPALAWVARKTALPALRQVALAVAGLVMIRLLLNWYVLDYALGGGVLINFLLAAYIAPAIAFATAARIFRREADDLVVGVLEAGAVAFVACFVALEIRHWSAGGDFGQPVRFTEAAVHVLTLSIQATMYLVVARRTGRRVLRWAAYVLGSLALLAATLLLVFNPAFIDVPAGPLALLAAYLVPAVLAALAVRLLSDRHQRRLLAGFAVVAGFGWISLQIRQVFHPGGMALVDVPIVDAEMWAWSGAWLVYGAALMALGIWLGTKTLRLTALAIIGLVCGKVFLIDMADLTGLWRVFSFLGLGLALIGLGVVHRRFVMAPRTSLRDADA